MDLYRTGQGLAPTCLGQHFPICACTQHAVQKAAPGLARPRITKIEQQSHQRPLPALTAANVACVGQSKQHLHPTAMAHAWILQRSMARPTCPPLRPGSSPLTRQAAPGPPRPPLHRPPCPAAAGSTVKLAGEAAQLHSSPFLPSRTHLHLDLPSAVLEHLPHPQEGGPPRALQALVLRWKLMLGQLVQHVDKGGALLVAALCKVVPQLCQLVLETLHLEGVRPQHVPQPRVADLHSHACSAVSAACARQPSAAGRQPAGTLLILAASSSLTASASGYAAARASHSAVDAYACGSQTCGPPAPAAGLQSGLPCELPFAICDPAAICDSAASIWGSRTGQPPWGDRRGL